MASYDIVSLFTNIPIDQTISIACNLAFSSCDLFHGFDRPTFTKLLQFACKNTHFLFNDSIYHQVDGAAMGSPLGPTLANLFLCHFESTWLQQCPNSFKPKIYNRYVDDTFTCFSNSSHLDQFLDYLNAQHPNIKFTMEKSMNDTISFLDTKISRNNTSFAHQVYRKATFTGLGTNFHSFIFSKFKTNSIKTLIHRAFHLSSSYAFFNTEVEFLKKFFANNGYPLHLVDKTLKRFLDNLYSLAPVKLSAPKKPLYCPLPFLGAPSEFEYRSLFKALSNYYPHINFRPILKSFTTIGSLFPFKDRVPSTLRSCAIYKFTCSGCHATYVGSTRRRTCERICEHRGVSNRTGKPLTSPSFSHIFNHSIDANHPISPDDFKILSYFSPNSLITAESITILQLKPSLNHQSASTPLYITDSLDTH